MWRKKVPVKTNSGWSSSDEEINPRDRHNLTAADRQNIDYVDRYLENRLEQKGRTWSERCDDTAVENHFQEQLAQTPTEQLESVRASHKQFWEALRVDRDSYMKQLAGINGPSGNVHEHGWINGALKKRGREIRRSKYPGVEVPNIDSQASPRFASLSCSGMKQTKEVPEKQQVSIVEQPLLRVTKEGTKDGLILVGVFGAVGIGVAWRYSGQLTKSVKHLLKTWFGCG